MDVNGTKFHLLLTREDWAKAAQSGDGELLGEIWRREDNGETVDGQEFRWDEEKNEITLEKLIFKFTASIKDEKPKLEKRRGGARDRYGNWYWVDESGLKIKVLSNGSKNVTDFYPAGNEASKAEKKGDFSPLEADFAKIVEMRGIAVTIDHFLVVGTIEPSGLLIFDLFAGGEPRRVRWRNDAKFSPFDIAARRCGGVFVLDRDNKRYWTLDRNYQPISNKIDETSIEDDFQPFDEPAKREHGERPRAENYYSEILETHSPVSIESLPDDTILILDSPETQNFSKIYRYFGERLLDTLATDSILSKVESEEKKSPANSFRLRGFDFAFLEGDEVQNDRIFIVSEEGNQTYSFRLVCKNELILSPPVDLPSSVVSKNFELQPNDEFYPMRLYGGKGFVAADGKVYYDFGERWLPLTNQNRPRFVEKGSLITGVFDGKAPDCVWHRLLFDGCISSETKIEVYSRTANDKDEIKFADWQKEPELYLRGKGSELPFIERKTSKEKGFGTWELLFQKAKNRYLQLKIDFSGNGQRTPRISALRIYYPRFSYLEHYLPALYREDAQSASFLDRFLANIEGFYTTIEDRIAAAQMLFDVRSAPVEVLDWLADWLGVALDPAWSEDKRRLFIKRAIEFFHYRGTLRGLRIALRLALDECSDEGILDRQTAEQKRLDPIRIVERFQTRLTPDIIAADSVSDDDFPRVISLTGRWNPSQGADAISQRYREITGSNTSLKFSLVMPENAEEAAKWQQFAASVLGFTPTAAIYAERRNWQNFLRDVYHNKIADLNRSHGTNYANSGGEEDFRQILLPRGTEKNENLLADWQKFLEIKTAPSRIRKLWQDFLARRYRRVGQLNSLYNTGWKSFDDISLFDELPLLGKPLADWFQFESGVLPMHETAHRFTVLIPATLNGKRIESEEEQKQKLRLVERIVELEKPAHTTFDFRYYWNLFRLNEVRLGLDTLLGLGSRDPMLNPGLIIGQSFIGESRIGAAPVEKYAERFVLGSNGLKQNKDGEK